MAGITEGETEALLRDKARWYLSVGVARVWIVLPESREVLVIASGGEQRFGAGLTIPEQPELPGLSPQVADLFRQIDDR